MRLVCGLVRFDGAGAAYELLHAMVAQMSGSRRPSQMIVWNDHAVALALLDFSGRGEVPSALPERDGMLMAADVRLDDPTALQQSIGTFGSMPEDMLLLTFLKKCGPDDLGRILGDFAFASWDRKKQRLTCGRDVFGVRPLAYVHHPGKLFAFASLPQALHGSGIVAKKIDEEAVIRRVARVWCEHDSLIAGINRLPAAHYVEVSRNGFELRRYWQLDRIAIGTSDCTPQQAATKMRQLVGEAIRSRLPRAGEIGSHVSGGLDSSAIAVLAARQLREEGRTLHTYSFLDRQRNDILLTDETSFVDAVVRQEGDLDWTAIRPPAAVLPASGQTIDPDKMRSLAPDDPENAVCAAAEMQGVDIILSGWGGDEAATFNGQGTLAELFLRGRWRTLTREISALSRERGWPKSRIFRGQVLSNILHAMLPAPALDFAKRVLGRNTDVYLRTLLQRYLSPAARRRLAALPETPISLTADGRENRWRLINSPLVAERAEVWAQIGARHGLAFAFPLLDRRVVEFALSLPSELFLREGFRRRVFRDAMAGVLPDSVRLRHQKYQPFPGTFLDLADCRDELLDRIDRHAQNPRICNLIDIARLRRQVEAFPAAEQLREEMRGDENPTPPGEMLAALRILIVVEYLAQHGAEPKSPFGSKAK
jgi:asparagine synthase (glutamine-hydrolysing)